MNFDFTETQQMIRETARKFAEEELAPDSIERDEKEEFPHGGIKKLGELGFMGMMVPEEYWGAGLDMVSYLLTIEELSRVCAGLGVALSVHISVATYPIYLFGSEEQRNRFVIPMSKGALLGGFAQTEPTAGSDAAGIISKNTEIFSFLRR